MAKKEKARPNLLMKRSAESVGIVGRKKRKSKETFWKTEKVSPRVRVTFYTRKKPKKEPKRPILEKTTDNKGYSVEWANMKIIFLTAKKGIEEVYIEGPLAISPLLPRVSMVVGGGSPW